VRHGGHATLYLLTVEGRGRQAVFRLPSDSDEPRDVWNGITDNHRTANHDTFFGYTLHVTCKVSGK
jgi:hypothetical protein